MHFVASCIFAIGLTCKQLGRFVLPATFCDKNLEHVAREIKKRSIIIKFLLKKFHLQKTFIHMKVQNAKHRNKTKYFKFLIVTN
jgi:hypothetical protein